MLEYKKCNLRPIQEKDLKQILAWRNSESIRTMMFNEHLISWEEHLAWFQTLEKNESVQSLLFEYNETPYGQVNIRNIDKLHQRCYWGFYIGNTQAPKGSGLAMGYLAIDYVFNQIGVHKLCSEVLDYNEISRKYHMKLGFEEEGRLRQHIVKQGFFYDVICLAMFSHNWQATKLEKRNIWFHSEE